LLSFDSEDCFLALTDYTFDIAYLELLLPLLSGGCCVIADEEEKQNRGLLLEKIYQHNVTMIQATPTYWRYLLSHSQLLERRSPLTVIVGGEMLDIICAKQLLAFAATVWNAYGPTETTIWSSLHRVTQQDIDNNVIPIGYPIANTRFHILNKFMQAMPQDVPGGLYISGAGVADGYLNASLKTEKKDNPFVVLTLPSGESCKAYRTGDKVCLNMNNQLLFCSRYDEQVKIRGHRVALPEVEGALLQHSSIVEAAVKCWGIPPQNYLVAYIVAYKKELNEDQLRNYLRDQIYPNQLKNRL